MERKNETFWFLLLGVTVCSLALESPARKQKTSLLGRMQPSSGSSSCQMDLSKQSECVKERMTDGRDGTDPQRHHVHVVELGKDREGLQQPILVQPEQHPIYTAHHLF